METAGDIAACAPGDAQERLAQPDAVPPGVAVKPLDPAQKQAAVGRGCECLGLDGRVDRHARARRWRRHGGAPGNRDRLGKQQFQFVGSDPSPPIKKLA